MAINFYSLVEGQRQGESDAWNQLAQQRNAVTGELQIEDALRKRQEQQQKQQAATYLSPLLSYWQRAADQGTTDSDWLIQQRDAIMQDPNFQQFSPEVQQQVWQQLSSTLATTAERLQASGQREQLRQLWDAFGITSAPSVGQATGALQSTGIVGPNSQYQVSDDGAWLVAPSGARVPVDYAEAIARTNPTALPTAFANFQQTADERARTDAVLRARGWVPDEQTGYLVPPAQNPAQAALNLALGGVQAPVTTGNEALGPSSPLPTSTPDTVAGLPYGITEDDQRLLMETAQQRAAVLQGQATQMREQAVGSTPPPWAAALNAVTGFNPYGVDPRLTAAAGNVIPGGAPIKAVGNWLQSQAVLNSPQVQTAMSQAQQAQQAAGGSVPQLLAFVAQGLQTPAEASALATQSPTAAAAHLRALQAAAASEQNPVIRQQFEIAATNLQTALMNRTTP